MHIWVFASFVICLISIELTVAEDSLASDIYVDLELDVPSPDAWRRCQDGVYEDLYLEDINCRSFLLTSDVIICQGVTVTDSIYIGTGFSGDQLLNGDKALMRTCSINVPNGIVGQVTVVGSLTVIGRVDSRVSVKAKTLTVLPGGLLSVGAMGHLEQCKETGTLLPSLMIDEFIEEMGGSTIVVRGPVSAPKIILDDGSILITECGNLSAHRDGDEAAGVVISDGSIVIANNNNSINNEALNYLSQLVLANSSEVYFIGDTEVLSLTQLDNASILWSSFSVFSPILIIDDASSVQIGGDLRCPVLLNAIDGSVIKVEGALDAGAIQIYDGSSLDIGLGVVSLKNFVNETSRVRIGHDLIVGSKLHVHKGAVMHVSNNTVVSTTFQISSSSVEIEGHLNMTGNIVLSSGATLKVGDGLLCRGMTQRDILEIDTKLNAEVDKIKSSNPEEPEKVKKSAKERRDRRLLEKYDHFMPKIEDSEDNEKDESSLDDDEEMPAPKPFPGFFCSHSTTHVNGSFVIDNSWAELKQCELHHTDGSIYVAPDSGLINLYQGSLIKSEGNIEAGTALLASKNAHVNSSGTVHAAMVQLSHSSSIIAESLEVDLDLQLNTLSTMELFTELILYKLTSLLVSHRSTLVVPSIIRAKGFKGRDQRSTPSDELVLDEGAGAIFLTGRSLLDVTEEGGIDLSAEKTGTVVVQDRSVLRTAGPLVLRNSNINEDTFISKNLSLLRVENGGSVILNSLNNSKVTCVRTVESTILAVQEDICRKEASLILEQAVPRLVRERLYPELNASYNLDDAWDRYNSSEATASGPDEGI